MIKPVKYDKYGSSIKLKELLVKGSMNNRVAEVIWLPAKGQWKDEDGDSLIKTLSDDYKYDSWDTAQDVANQLNDETSDVIGHYDVILTDEEIERRKAVCLLT